MEITKYPGAYVRSDADGMMLLSALYSGSGEMRFPPPECLHAGEAAEPVAMGASGRLYTFISCNAGELNFSKWA